MLLVFFCLVQNGPEVTWVACISLKEPSKWSLGCTRAFLRPFWTFCNACDTQSQRAARMESPKNDGKWIIMLKKTSWPQWPPYFQNFHILTYSVEQAKLDIIHCCQLHWWTSCETTHANPKPLCCTLKSRVHKILMLYRTFAPRLEENDTLKCSSNIFP